MQKHFSKIQCRQKRISTLVGIIIIVTVAVVTFSGVFAYNYLAIKRMNNLGQFQNEQNQKQQILNKNFPLAGETTDQTAGWKTYSNTQYGFEIKYPSDALLFDTIGVDGIKNTSQINLTPKSSTPPLTISSTPSLTINVVTSDILAKDTISECPQGRYAYTMVKLNGMDFFRSDISTEYRGMNSRNEIAIEHCIMGNNGNKYALIVRGTYTPTDTLLKMMNTFKFTK